jgi:hypothetical protein
MVQSIESQIQDYNGKINLLQDELNRATESANAWGSQARAKCSTGKSKDVADCNFKRGKEREYLERMVVLKNEITAHEETRKGLRNMLEAEATSMVTLAGKGIDVQVVRIQSTALAKEVEIKAEADADIKKSAAIVENEGKKAFQKTQNQIFLGVGIILLVGIVLLIVRKVRKNKSKAK